MSKALNVLFVDDELQGEHSRRQLVELLNRDDRLSVVACHPVDLVQKLRDGFDREYVLFIVDYKLNSSPNEDGEFSLSNGYSITSLLKEKCPDVPVYLVSQILQLDYTMGEHYDKMMSHTVLTTVSGRNNLVHDCLDFESLKKKFCELTDQEAIANYLDVPEQSRISFFSSLPVEFKNGLAQKIQKNTSSVLDKEASFIRFAKWMNEIFLIKSGPLIGDKEVAVLFGLNLSYFNEYFLKKYEIEFLNCQYSGIFSRTNESRWWAQAVFDLAISLADEEYISEPWKFIPKKLCIDESQWSICHVCNEKFPECVAADPDDLEKYAVHWRCAIVAEDQDELPGFNPVYYIDDLE